MLLVPSVQYMYMLASCVCYRPGGLDDEVHKGLHQVVRAVTQETNQPRHTGPDQG